VVAAVLIAGLLVWRQAAQSTFSWTLFVQALRGLHWLELLLGCTAVYLTYYVRALRWAVFLEPLTARPDIGRLTKATMIGFTAIVLLGRPGEFVRPYLIARYERVSFPSQVAALILERVYDLLAALLVFGAGLSQVDRSGATTGPGLQWVLEVGGKVVVVLAMACLLVLFGSKYYSSQLKGLADWATRRLTAGLRSRITSVIHACLAGMESTRNAGAVLRIGLYTTIEWLLILAATSMVLRSFGPAISISPTDLVIFTGFLAFGAVVQIPGIGGGMQVVTILVLTELFGNGLEVSTSVALILWVVTFLTIVPVGLLLALRDGLRWSALAHVREEVA
jgi:uncharacterized protein (TIRG00374 family)